MKKFLFFSLLLLINACSSINSKEVTKAETKISSTQPDKSFESSINAPVDIWERIRLELSISIPDDQIAATSLYRAVSYTNLTLPTILLV